MIHSFSLSDLIKAKKFSGSGNKGGKIEKEIGER